MKRDCLHYLYLFNLFLDGAISPCVIVVDLMHALLTCFLDAYSRFLYNSGIMLSVGIYWMSVSPGLPSVGRNYYIDFLRGLAAINIVFIHTAFWSGSQYVPVWFQSLSLLIDVPLFFFIAGWAFSYSNSFEKSLLNVFKTHFKYTVFLVLYTIAIFVFHHTEFSPASALNTFFFVFPKDNLLLPVVGSSFWFLPVYYCVSIVAQSQVTVFLALLLKLISDPLERLFNRLVLRTETRT